MAEFINTIDALGDEAVIDSIIDKTIATLKDSEIKDVGKFALFKCKMLTEVDLPACEIIRESAFDSCIALESVSAENVTEMETYGFNGCTSLTNVYMPKLTKVTGGTNYGTGHAFFGCTSLESIDLPLLTDCGFGAFRNCTALREVNLPALNTWSQSVFTSCTSLEKICLPSQGSLSTGFLSYCTKLKLADLPNATSLGNSVVGACSSLTALILRNTGKVCSLGSWCFEKTPIESGTGYIYVPRALVDGYKVATNWSAYASQIRALEDYTVDGTITGELDESKI